MDFANSTTCLGFSHFTLVPAAALTPFVVLAVLRLSLHAVVQLHEDGLQARVHPLDELVVHHQRPQQYAKH